MIDRIPRLSMVSDYVSAGCPAQLLIVDVDETLVRSPEWRGSEGWYEKLIVSFQRTGLSSREATLRANEEWELLQDRLQPVPVEAGTASLIREWQRIGIPMMGLTARRPSFAERTERQLRALDIDLSLTRPLARDVELDASAAYRGGILFVGPVNDKGEYFSRFLKEMDRLPGRLVFVDDKVHNVLSFSRSACQLELGHAALHYAPLRYHWFE